jgi:hypothetical protein
MKYIGGEKCEIINGEMSAMAKMANRKPGGSVKYQRESSSNISGRNENNGVYQLKNNGTSAINGVKIFEICSMA